MKNKKLLLSLMTLVATVSLTACSTLGVSKSGTSKNVQTSSSQAAAKQPVETPKSLQDFENMVKSKGYTAYNFTEQPDADILYQATLSPTLDINSDIIQYGSLGRIDGIEHTGWTLSKQTNYSNVTYAYQTEESYLPNDTEFSQLTKKVKDRSQEWQSGEMNTQIKTYLFQLQRSGWMIPKDTDNNNSTLTGRSLTVLLTNFGYEDVYIGYIEGVNILYTSNLQKDGTISIPAGVLKGNKDSARISYDTSSKEWTIQSSAIKTSEEKTSKSVPLAKDY